MKTITEKNVSNPLFLQQKMLDTIVNKDKILGYVMGKMTVAKLEERTIEQRLLLEPITNLMKSLDDDFYRKARTMPIDKFWKGFLLDNWPKVEAKLTNEEVLNDLSDVLASVFHHKPKVVHVNNDEE